MHDTYDHDHTAIVELRARKRRQRQFSRHTLGSSRPGLPGNCEMLVEADEEPVWDQRHVRRREELVNSFMITWDNGEAEWLTYPIRKK
jgi:hypothetical protein